MRTQKQQTTDMAIGGKAVRQYSAHSKEKMLHKKAQKGT